jgi:hypothetical protein
MLNRQRDRINLKIFIMTSFRKEYLGKGVRHEKLDLVKVTLRMDEVLKHKHEFEGDEYITFEVAKLQDPDKFGRTHTAYVSVKEKTSEAEPEKGQKGRKPKK